MDYFLQHIAKSLWSEYGDTLNTHSLVFPGRRAGLFFMKYLANELRKPAWAPSVLTISELFRSYSGLQPADNEILLFELYRVYRSVTKSGETFDDFYFWGDMLLSDFDDVDKYLAEASKLFTTVSDLKKIDQQFGGLTSDQARIVKQFWTNFDPDRETNEKARFLGIWSHILDIYSGFRDALKEKNIAYEGMIFRDVTENKRWEKTDGLKPGIVHFIGFNALNECEKTLMKALKSKGKARFYWDYDESYMNPGRLNSAGFFLKENIAALGNDMPEGWNYRTLLSSGPGKVERKVVDASSDIAQVKLLSRLIDNIEGLNAVNAHETAVILADENLLIPLLTSLPENISDFNITMGYPLKLTQVYSLVRQLIEMQDNITVSDGEVFFSSACVKTILNNSLVTGLAGESGREILKEIEKSNLVRIPSSMFAENPVMPDIFRKLMTVSEITDYMRTVLAMIATSDKGREKDKTTAILPPGIRNEFIYRTLLSINRLSSVMVRGDIEITLKTWSRLLDRMLRSQSVPFSGEPLSGIQIMGILETRALDFRNLIILSVNEGILPALTASSSFIPFSLREAFGLPSINHQESVYAYHFYRLLHRAENVTFVYNSNPEGLRSGEMSRFLQQMKYEPAQIPSFTHVALEIINPVSVRNRIERNAEHNRLLRKRFAEDKGNRLLSPLAINTWLNCRMRFYYRYVEGIREKDKISDEIDPAMLGILLHECMRNLYGHYTGKILTPSDLEMLSGDDRLLLQVISNAVSEKFRKGNDSLVAVNEMIVKGVLKVYISRILETDLKYAPFRITGLETPVSFPMNVNAGADLVRITAGGTIDRIDEQNGITRIIDYKTGSTAGAFSSLGLLFEDDRPKERDGWLQIMLYCESYLKVNPDIQIVPMVYQVRKKPSDTSDERLLIRISKKEGFFVEDYRKVREEYMDGLQTVISTIFSPDEPFEMTADARTKCSYCPYNVLCQRQ